VRGAEEQRFENEDPERSLEQITRVLTWWHVPFPWQG
jgi:hypothetical protein